jgi:hypothetical protein
MSIFSPTALLSNNPKMQKKMKKQMNEAVKLK